MPCKKSNDFIRDTTTEDIRDIHEWLICQDRREIHGSFLCNWDVINRSYNEGNLSVFIDAKTNKPVAYFIKDFGVLEVKESHRGKGIGRALVEYGINLALKSDSNYISLECAPSTSIPFWKHMGFELYSQKMAYKKLQRENDVLDGSTPIPVKISFYPECRRWKKDTLPHDEFFPDAFWATDGFIELKQRVSIFTRLPVWHYEPIVRIEVDSKLIYEDKAKYEEASWLGVSRDENSFYIDYIDLDD